jgi:hypothetical protein
LRLPNCRLRKPAPERIKQIRANSQLTDGAREYDKLQFIAGRRTANLNRQSEVRRTFFQNLLPVIPPLFAGGLPFFEAA